MYDRRERGRVCSPLRGADTDGLPSPRATNLVVVILAWSLNKAAERNRYKSLIQKDDLEKYQR